MRSCSDTVVNSSAGQKKEDWKTRKNRYIEHLSLVGREYARALLPFLKYNVGLTILGSVVVDMIRAGTDKSKGLVIGFRSYTWTEDGQHGDTRDREAD